MKNRLRIPKPKPENYLNFKIGKADASISAKISVEDSSIIVELYLSGESAKSNYIVLSSKKEEIENQLNANLD